MGANGPPISSPSPSAYSLGFANSIDRLVDTARFPCDHGFSKSHKIDTDFEMISGRMCFRFTVGTPIIDHPPDPSEEQWLAWE